MTGNYLQCHKEKCTHITSTTINKMINPDTEAQLCFIHSCTTFYDNILVECPSLLWNFRVNKIYHFALILELLGRSKDCFTLISAKDLDVMTELKLLLSIESNCQRKHVGIVSLKMCYFKQRMRLRKILVQPGRISEAGVSILNWIIDRR